eukprot:g7681.t2
MNAAGGRCTSGAAMRALCLRRSGDIAKALRGSGCAVSQHCLFSSSTRTADEGADDSTTRARNRARAQEWASDDQRHNRWRSGGRHQRSRQDKQKKRDKTWQTSDPHEDLCRIKWEPDPDQLPKNWFRGHIPDMIKCEMFDLWQADPEKNTAMSLAKRFGLPYLDTQAILTLKLRAKEKAEADPDYEIYPELEEIFTERKEAFIEDLAQHYGQDIPFLYEHHPDTDKNDPRTWTSPKEFKMGKLTEMDKNSKFDCPPLQSQDEVAEDLKYKRTNKAIYAAVRDEEAAELTKKLEKAPKLPKRRWSYALKDTSTKESAKSPPVLRDADGVMRGATVDEERGLSYADDNLFRRDVRRPFLPKGKATKKMDVQDVIDSEEWQAATSAISTKTSAIPVSAWCAPLARHLKLRNFLDGGDSRSGGSISSGRANKDPLEDECSGGGGHTHPLHVAASQNILKLGRLLLSGTAVDPNVQDGSGRTALHWAALTERAGFLLLLLESGAAIDAVDAQNRSPLLSGSAFGAAQTVRLLLHWGADASLASREGFTPLHGAASGGHADVAEALVAAGADVHKRTDMGANPRHLAERQGHAGVVRVLSLAASRGSSFSSGTEDGGLWFGCGDGGVGVGGVVYEERRGRDVFAQHRFDRQSLLQRPLFR